MDQEKLSYPYRFSFTYKIFKEHDPLWDCVRSLFLAYKKRGGGQLKIFLNLDANLMNQQKQLNYLQ